MVNAIIFPNPSKGIIHLRLDHTKIEPFRFHITDFSGNQVFFEELESENGRNFQKIDLTGLADGKYVAHLSVDNYDITRSLVIRR